MKLIFPVFLIILLLIFPSNVFSDNVSPKVALVLSGGSALGMAHVGVLGILEEIGIPIDLVVGTSMGALVGGLYAAGYTPAELEHLVKELNWAEVFTEPDSFLTYVTEPVIDEHKMLLSFNFDWNGVGKRLALLPDQQIVSELSRLFFPVSAVRDFDQFEIPFRAVATDLISGEPYVFSSGRIVQALRASMSIPGIFAPYPVNGHYYLDGGLVSNLPVKAARDAGADIVIAVDVDPPTPKSIDEFGTVVDVTIQATNLMLQGTERDQEEDSDVFIHPDMEGFYRTGFFHSEDIIERGREAGEAAREELEELAVYLKEFRVLEPKDPDRVGLAGSDPVYTISAVVKAEESTESFPLNLFGQFINTPFDAAELDLLQLRIDQVSSSDLFESIGYGLRESSEGGVALEIVPIPLTRGKNSFNTGFRIETAVSTSSEKSWYITPALFSSLKFTKLFSTSSYLSLDLDLEDQLSISLQFHLPLMGGVYIEPHAAYEHEQFRNDDKTDMLLNTYTTGLRVGYSFNPYVEVGLDSSAVLKWYQELDSGTLVKFNPLPVIASYFQWRSSLPSRFNHTGADSFHEISFSFLSGNSWYYRIRSEHEQAIPLTLNSTFFYDVRVNSYRGEIVSPDLMFDAGGWEAIPGYLPEKLTGTDTLVLGAGYRQRIPALSQAIGMDSYVIGMFRAGNSYDGIPSAEELSLRFGGAVGLGIDLPVGELIAGVGVNDSLEFAYYFQFN